MHLKLRGSAKGTRDSQLAYTDFGPENRTQNFKMANADHSHMNIFIAELLGQFDNSYAPSHVK
jgi:hypothetical protein